MVEVIRQAGVSTDPLQEAEIYVDGARGVYAPHALDGAEIVLVGAIIEEEFEVSRYEGTRIARKVLTALRQHAGGS